MNAHAAGTAEDGRFDRSAIGVVTTGEPYLVTAESIAAYEAAIGAHASARPHVAPAIYVCVPAWRTAWAAMARFDRGLTRASAEGLGLHESHAMRFGRDIVAGMVLTTRSSVVALRTTARGSTVHLLTETFDADGAFVASQESTSVFRDETGACAIGEIASERDGLPASVYRRAASGETTRILLADQGERYAVVSHDDAPLHLDDAAARRLGLPGTIVQGMCILAIACDSAAQVLGLADMRLAAIRTRFARPIRPGAAFTTRIWEHATAPARTIGFESFDDFGKTILKQGAIVLR